MMYIATIKVLELIGLLGSFAFVVMYALEARWWATQIGQNLMVFSLVNFGIFALSTWGLFVGPKVPYEKVITVALLTIYAGALWWRIWIFVWLRFKRYTIRKEDEEVQRQDREGRA